MQRTTVTLQIIKTLSEKQILPAQSEPPLGKAFQAPSKKKKTTLCLPGTPLLTGALQKESVRFLFISPNNNNKMLISWEGRGSVAARCGERWGGQEETNVVWKAVLTAACPAALAPEHGGCGCLC